MKKKYLLLIGAVVMGGSIISAAPDHTFPDKAFENYDIRNVSKKDGSLTTYRDKVTAGTTTQTSRAVHQLLATGREELLSRVPNLRVEDNPFGTAPETIDVTGATAALTESSNEAHEPLVRRFIAENAALYGLTPEQVNQLQIVADYTNPTGNLSWVEYEQRINGIFVFQGYLRAAVTGDGRIWRTTGNPAAGLNYTRLPTAAGLTPAAAAVAAAKTIGVHLSAASLRTLSFDQKKHLTKLSKGPFTEEIQVELVYFSVEPGLATLAYSMVLWEPRDAYWILVDANNGQLLWRKNITNDQTQSVTYSVYDDDSPTPLSPTNALPGSGIQGTAISRSTITNISELPAFDNLGWIPDGAGNAVTTGNNVDAGLDISGPNGIDAGGRATGTGRVFNFVYAPGGTPGEEAPTGAAYRMGIVTHLFFWSNRYHDRLYQYGFTEPARNFQNNNFGRGGLDVDYVRAEAQDSSGTNNANFSTPADGSLPRMQMYIFTGPTIDRDGDVDDDVVIHELTHGTSNRLHGNASGLSTTQSVGMGEGWSDFYGRCLLSTASEDVNAIYAMGGYATLNYTGSTGLSVGTDNYYYGIRRFPYAVKTNVGGPTALRPGQPHNPLTFADIDVALNSIVDGAYDKSPAASNTANASHRIGEVWCMMLLEMRARIITRMGWAAGNDRTLQIVTDGMKLDPAGPTLLQGRDSILAADCASFAGADEQDIWAGFATRGAGFSARTTGGTTTAADVTEAFDLPNLTLGTVTFTDTGGNGNGNGFADPGETVSLTIPLVNPYCGTPATTTTANVTGGGTGNYGTIAGGAVVSQVISYTVPPGTPCGTVLTIPVDINSSVGPVTRNFTLTVGQPVIGSSEAFDSVVAPALPAGWTTTHTGALANWVTSTTNPSNAPNDAFANEVITPATSELVSTPISITSASAQLTFKNLYNLEATFDGLLLEVSIPSVAGGAYQDILTAGGSFVVGGYNSTLSTSSDNPLEGRQCWTGLSGGTTSAPAYITTTVSLPAVANGQSIRLKWRRADDTGTVTAGAPGARIDDIKIVMGFSCSPVISSPTPTPTPTPPTPTPTPSPTPTPTPSPTPTPGVVFLSPLKDNTLYQDVNGELSNGQGIYFFAGMSGQPRLRRALIAFDLTSIPSNATITGANLFLYLTQETGGPQAISLHGVLQDWGEGASDAGDPGGIGAQAATNDATWLHTFYNASFWSTAGGDFSPTVSATTIVDAIDTTYTWGGSGLIADVQEWVSNPAGNFGWIIRGEEITGGTAKKFNSRQNSINPPLLTLTYEIPTPTPTPPPINISGTILYCPNPSLDPLPDVTLTLTGDMGGSTVSDGSGNYMFTALPSGGDYTVTPSQTALTPGTAGINTVDVIGVQRHFLSIAPLPSGCRLMAADVTADSSITTADVIAIQRFALGSSTGIGNTGEFSFNPTDRTYSGVVTDQTDQDYDALIFGDVASPFVASP